MLALKSIPILYILNKMRRMRRFLDNRRRQFQGLLQDDSSHALYDHRGYIRP